MMHMHHAAAGVWGLALWLNMGGCVIPVGRRNGDDVSADLWAELILYCIQVPHSVCASWYFPLVQFGISSHVVLTSCVKTQSDDLIYVVADETNVDFVGNDTASCTIKT